MTRPRILPELVSAVGPEDAPISAAKAFADAQLVIENSRRFARHRRRLGFPSEGDEVAQIRMTPQVGLTCFGDKLG